MIKSLSYKLEMISATNYCLSPNITEILFPCFPCLFLESKMGLRIKNKDALMKKIQ